MRWRICPTWFSSALGGMQALGLLQPLAELMADKYRFLVIGRRLDGRTQACLCMAEAGFIPKGSTGQRRALRRWLHAVLVACRPAGDCPFPGPKLQ